MKKLQFNMSYVACTGLAIAFAVTAQAGISKSFVATYGSNANACTASAYCRTFDRALEVTNPGGEIVVEDSGNYGATTITQPVTITANGVAASIVVVTPGQNAITINTSGNVTINGLNLYGSGGTGGDGIIVQQVGFLRLYNMLIQGFSNDGIHFTSGGSNLAMYSSKIYDNGHDGLLLQASGAQAWVDGTDFDHNAFAGADSVQGSIALADSYAHYNQYGFFANGGTVSLFADRAIYNTNGIAAAAGGTLNFANCLISNNTNAYNIFGGGTIAGSNPGTSLVTPGQGMIGTLSTAVVLL